jgi:ATP phosphoribosyltransferase regulatory subunit
MNKFEEYDLYARNKDFLISDSIITFTDRSGKLMALKPDVTLSIVKNTADTGSVQKLYYNENVYRVSKGSGVFREMLQVGLECLGRIDDYAIFEVLLLAAKSLLSISQLCVLDISHLALVTQLLDAMAIPRETHANLFSAMSEKNLHDILARISGGDLAVVDLATEHYRMKKDYREQIVKAVREYKEQHNQL